MPHDATIFAYLAGMIDGDGYISIQVSTKDSRYFTPVVGIAGTRREPHDLAASIWGGKVHRYVPKNPAHRPQFQWSIYGAEAVAAIESIYPYLRIKQAQADVAFEAWTILQDRRFTRDDPFPWFGPDFDSIVRLSDLADEIAGLNLWRRRSGKKRAGRLLDGREWNEFPVIA